MRVISAEEIEACAALSWPALVDAAESALVATALNAVDVPLRAWLPLPEGTLVSMPGRIHGDSGAAVKLLSIVSGNASRNLPTIQGVVVLFDAVTGEVRALLHGAALTAVRTAAVTAAAVRRLGHAHRRMAVIGAGEQAAWHMRALIALYPLESVVVWSPTAARCARLAARISEEEGLPVSAAASAAEAVAGADLVVCCTSAATPVVHARMLGAGDVTVAAIGAYTPQMVEVDPSVFALAGTVYVDDLTGALHEAGDVLAALRSGAVAADAVSPIGGDVRRARVALFKSVGNAAQDAAVAGAIAGPPHE